MTRDASNARRVSDGNGTWGVVRHESSATGPVLDNGRKADEDYQPEPCGQCPWRMDQPTGRFPVEVFRHSARTAYDLATERFGCHMSPRDRALTCAGFLLNGATHNLSVRMNPPAGPVADGGLRLYPDYVSMAVANGVDWDDPAFGHCRGLL